MKNVDMKRGLKYKLENCTMQLQMKSMEFYDG
jgi:hypothetical protein